VRRTPLPQGPASARLDVEVPTQSDQATDHTEYIRWLSQLQADVAQSLGGIMLQGARPVPLGTAPGGTKTLSRSAGRLVGWSLHETSGTNPALVRFWDGREAGANPLAYISVPAGLTVNMWNPPGISVTDALLVEFVTGGSLSTTVEGVAYLGAAD
jgi:hypothetical protein